MEFDPKTSDSAQISSQPVLDDITVVIPTLGRRILRDSLQRIAHGSRWPAQIIIVDQSSSPVIAGWLEELRFRGLDAQHVSSSQTGRAAGVNRGIERVKTRFVAVTDDDCFVDSDWLMNMTANLRQSPEVIITGRVEAEGNEEVLVTVTSRTPGIQRRPRLTYDSMCGGNMGAATDVIKRIGLLDEDPCLRTAEDCEYSYRALRSRVPIIYAPDVVVRHFGWRQEIERKAQYRDYARSHAGFFGKYLRRGDWFIALRVIVHFLRALRRWARGVIRGNRDLALNGRAYVTELIPGILAGWRSGRPSRIPSRLSS